MPTLGESIARRRNFWALVALVVVPTVALFGYGLAGLKDRADAEEGRLRERYALQARALESELLARFSDEDAALRKAFRGLDDEGRALAIALWRPTGLVREVWAIDDPELPPEALAAATRLTEVSPVLVLPGADAEGDIALSRVSDGVVVAWRLDARVVDAVAVPEVVGRLFPTEEARYHVHAVPPDAAGAPVSFDGLRRRMAETLLEDDAFVSRTLAPPFSHWRLEITGPTGPPASGWGLRSTMISLFLLTVVGVVLLGRAVAQQTRLSRLQTDFVSTVSHELRTPLTSIRLFVETLQSGRVTDPDKVQECLTIIAVETERLSRKIERVLTWARMEAGRRIYELRACTPREITDRAIGAFRAHDLANPAQLRVEVPETLPKVAADPDAIAEALLNLLGNARKFGGPGVHITLSAAREARGVRFSVEDDGPGIALLEQRRVFEKFYRADGLLSRRTEGSGLGLAIVHGIVTAHAGRITLQSVEGSGSRFNLWLPLGERED